MNVFISGSVFRAGKDEAPNLYPFRVEAGKLFELASGCKGVACSRCTASCWRVGEGVGAGEAGAGQEAGPCATKEGRGEATSAGRRRSRVRSEGGGRTEDQ